MDNDSFLESFNCDDLSTIEISELLENHFIGKNIICYPVTTSTNDILKTMADNEENEGTVVISDKQTSGKGRLGKIWESENRSGIFMSILLRPNISPMQAAQLTLVVAIAVCRAISKSITSERLNNIPFIKWPNDIVLNGKKLCGILTELKTENDLVKYVICGIGINVAQAEFPADISNTATSLLLETGVKFRRNVLIATVINEFATLYNNYKTNEGFTSLLDEYKKMCINMNREVKIINGSTCTIGKVTDIGDRGELIVQTENGEIKTVISGEVSVRGLDGYV